MPICFITRDRKGVDLNRRGGGEERESVEGGETYQNILCEKSIFNKRKKEGICRQACTHTHTTHRCLQSLIQVFNKVLFILQAHGESNQCVADPQGSSVLLRHRCMGHDCSGSKCAQISSLDCANGGIVLA